MKLAVTSWQCLIWPSWLLLTQIILNFHLRLEITKSQVLRLTYFTRGSGNMTGNNCYSWQISPHNFIACTLDLTKARANNKVMIINQTLVGWSWSKIVLINNNDQQKCNDHNNQPLSVTEALTCLHLVSARGLDQVHQHYPCSQSSSFLGATASPSTYLPAWLG